MRIPKWFLLLNGLLLLCAIASWTWFMKEQSQARQMATASSFPQNFLGLRLPSSLSSITVALEVPGGTSIDPFPSIIGKVVGPAEVKQLRTYTQFLAAISVASEVSESANWVRLGEARLPEAEGMQTVQVYQAPEDELGFEYEGTRYRTAVNAKSLLDFFRAPQR